MSGLVVVILKGESAFALSFAMRFSLLLNHSALYTLNILVVSIRSVETISVERA